MLASTRAVDVERLVLLGVVAEPQAVAGHDLAGVGRLDPGQDPQQGGLAGTVQAEDDHLAALVDRQIDAGEDLQRAVRLGQVRTRSAASCRTAPAPGTGSWPPGRRPARPPGRPAAARPGGPCSARPSPWSPWPASCRPGSSAGRPSARRSPARAGGASRRSRAAAGSASSPSRRRRARPGSRRGGTPCSPSAASRATSWLITISPPLWPCRKLRSQAIESASRWLVGSSSSSVSAPENRIRASSTRRR